METPSREPESIHANEWVRLWTIKYLRKQFWRVAGYMEFEDLMQEAAIIWMAVQRRYAVHGERSVMAAFKISIHNRVNDLSTKSTRHRNLYDPVALESLDAEEHPRARLAATRRSDVSCLLEAVVRAGPEALQLFEQLTTLDDRLIFRLLGVKRRRKAANGAGVSKRETNYQLIKRICNAPDVGKSGCAALQHALEISP